MDTRKTVSRIIESMIHTKNAKERSLSKQSAIARKRRQENTYSFNKPRPNSSHKPFDALRPQRRKHESRARLLRS